MCEACPTTTSESTYESRIPYNPERIHAAAVYCSDGRVGDHFDDFLQNGLQLPRYDRLALPGGPASLAGHTEAHVAEQGVVDELKFLVDVHQLERIILIAHQGCAFYSTRLQLPEPFLEQQQRIDLLKAKQFAHRITGIDRIDAYFAHRHGEEKVTFEHVVMP
jgi:hypothetical protein